MTVHGICNRYGYLAKNTQMSTVNFHINNLDNLLRVINQVAVFIPILSDLALYHIMCRKLPVVNASCWLFWVMTKSVNVIGLHCHSCCQCWCHHHRLVLSVYSIPSHMVNDSEFICGIHIGIHTPFMHFE